MSVSDQRTRKPLVVTPGQARRYDIGRMRAAFFADADETGNRYSISEWWLDPRTEGPGAHSHEDDHIFYVLLGTLTLLIDDKITTAPRGTYILIPGGILYDFENRGAKESGFICINVPAGFEQMMPQLVAWFSENPLGDVKDA